MEFNKCSRCGNFYISNDLVCPKCKAKDAFEFETFQSYIQENGLTQNLDTISSQTGISVKNLNRFLDYSGYNNYIDGLENIKL
ncbi:MAG: hypothetical protein ACLUHC_02415 [Clostridia bacterium]